ncbi:UDP-N-acetylmuramoyl-tripeptide--D-alanyl-D-alanine ligase [Thalassoporum mexicanum PCC 7367]|uniref:UDP-N-acetylmuramoyl-tripeptide--D-alanyl-D- alanine ligase n=1 Tax=Thalassoporum mexicanum TaxID=3457544 RepID=UPI00029F9950|nr:UDP-N-acetylmuramoyl-tripeptide--D-alanyl-D-alanine ligase [Pseudanabaena sp. PCC 7367]AFY69960.1 UDP-N-acetylmuramoyl-tripeptide--D-alanyl-D-alanine ligase [Pseudanabaena sp. PCC 7367]
MTFSCTIAQAAEAMNAVVVESKPTNGQVIQGISTDSRQIKPGQLFVALQGENFDGHRFVGSAIAQGAVAVVVNHPIEMVVDQQGQPIAQLVVTDTLRAYQDLAQWWCAATGVPIVAITGSAGKTTTKELIAALLGLYVRPGKQVHKNYANYNNDIGVAHTLLAIDPELHDFAVVEMAMRGLGEIARLSQMASPKVGVITNIGTAHIGRLGSKQAIAQAKCELLAEMPTDGIAVLNAEDQLLLDTAAQVWSGQVITYGLNSGDVRGDWQGNTLSIGDRRWQLPLVGRHNALNFLAGLATLKALGLDWQIISQTPIRPDMPSGRSQIHHLTSDITILDETYNASPEATIAALELLAATTAKRRWAILGTMKELGTKSAELHGQVGQKVADLGIDGLIVLADGEADAILAAAQASENPPQLIISCQSHQELIDRLQGLIQSGDRLLFKASHSVGMDKVVQALIAANQE